MCGDYNFKVCGEPFAEGRKTDEDLCTLNCLRGCSHLFTTCTMAQNFTPTFVYKRRRHHRNSAASCTTQPFAGTKPSDGCHSSISAEAPPVAAQEVMASASELATESAWSPVVCPVVCDRGAKESFNECPTGEEAGSEEALISDADRVLNAFSVSNDCSSSKSNLDLGSSSLKIDMDDRGECSSGAFVAVKALDDISERDICISFLRSCGLLAKVWTRQNRAFAEIVGRDNCCSKTCKVCEQLETTKNLLICDNCEDAFHITCCNPHITRIPAGEWLCSSCLKKKHKIQKEKSSSSSVNIRDEIGRNGNSASEGELGSLEFMFRDTEPHMSSVRIGDEFQANVPDWSGPIDDEYDLIGDPLEIDASKNDNTQEWNSPKSFKLSSIGNWLQCRGTIDGIGADVDGTICGKWRRAPLFEVQTDDWECFGCVHWDPAHADCAVPQELDTEEITKQLKYIEMLRPRLAAKRRKLNCSKSNGSQDLSRS